MSGEDQHVAPMGAHTEFLPVTETDAEIDRFLTEAVLPVVVASIVHITGDPAWIRGPIRPHRFVPLAFDGGLGADEQDELRAAAVRAIATWRDAGCPEPRPLPREVQRELIDWLAAQPVEDDEAAVLLEEMDLDGTDPRAIRVPPDTEQRREDLSVVIIGAGMGGLLAAIRLRQAGIPFRLIEKGTDVGGTWWHNRYPGARVDVASHYYSYSFAPNHGFTEYWARQPELHAYFREHFDAHEIEQHVTWSTEVERAEWREADERWEITARHRDGRVETLHARAVISAVGVLSRPLIPDFPGLDRFQGRVMHSAEWDESVELTGKRVALVGAGASGFQLGPAIVDDVASLTVFQRTPQWMAPNPRYHATVTPGERWAARHLPLYSRWYRCMHVLMSSDKALEGIRIDPDWPDFPRTANALNAARRDMFVSWIDSQIEDPEFRAKVTPTYPPSAKRLLQDNGSWLSCLTRDHVELVQDTITELDEHAIVTADGRYEVDVIALATGFRANEVLAPMEITGRDGVSLTTMWDDRPSAYAGISMPGFPNFFVIGGPGTGLAHGGSIIFAAECQVRYIGEALSTLLETDRTSIEPSQAAYDRWTKELQAELDTLIWGHESIENSWYKAADGRVYVLNPFGNVPYWKLTSSIELDDHVLR